MKARAFFALSSLIVLAASSIACGPPPNKGKARRVGKDATLDSDAPSSLANVQFVESERDGEPFVTGCADGQREGFADIKTYPTIAGCLAVWDGEMNLRKGKTSKTCGDDLDVCSSPADVCAQGWHVCARDGDYHDLTDRISDKQCAEGAGPGKFVAAISHVKTKGECADPPGPTTRYPCLDEGYGAEPVCCGESCRPGQCRDAVWPKQTLISMGKAEGCAAVTSERNGGILCCKDADAVPPPPTPPEGGAAPPTAEAGEEAGAAEAGEDEPDPTKDITGAEKGDAEKGDAEKGAAKKGAAKKGDAKKGAKKDDAEKDG